MINTGSKGFIGGTPDTPNPYSGGGSQNAARALGSIGRELSRAGKMGEDVALQLQAVKNAAVEREKMNEIETAFAKHEAENMGIRNPEEKLSKFEIFASETQAKLYDGDYMPPAVKRNLEAKWGNIVTAKRNRALTQAGQLMVERTRAAFGVAMDNAETLEEWEAVGDDAHEKNMMTAPELAAYKKKGFDKFQSIDIEIARKDDPFTLLKDLESGEYKLDKTDRIKQIYTTERAVDYKRREITGDIADKIYSGELQDPKMIDELGKQLRPKGRVVLQNALRQFKDNNKKLLLLSPEYQSMISGQVALAVQAYKPNGEAFDEQYAGIRTLIGQMQPSPLRDEYVKQLNSIRDGRELEIKNVQDWGYKQISDAQSDIVDKIEKPKTKKITVLQYLDDGLFTKENLVKIGLPEGVSAKIENASDIKTPHDEKIRLYKKAWDERDKSVKLTEWEENTYGAIASGKGLQHVAREHEDPASRMAYQSKMKEVTMANGQVLLEYADYIKQNPKATYEQTRQKIIELGIHAESRTSENDWRPKRPSYESPKTSLVLPPTLKKHAESFEYYGEKYGVDPRFLAAISQLETNNGKSSAYRNKRNAMGVSNNKGPISFKNAEDSIERMARVLASKNGPYRKVRTLKGIAAIYAPPGAGNDPKKTNSYWPEGVAKYLREQGVENPYQEILVHR